MLSRIALLSIAMPRRIVGIAALVMVAAAIFGIPVTKSLAAGGFQDPTAESSQATQLLTDKFRQGDMQMFVTVTSPAGFDTPNARTVATRIVDGISHSPHVAFVNSAWTSPPQAAGQMVSKDGKSGLIVAGIDGGENDAQKYAQALADEFIHDGDGVTVRAGGTAMVYSEINAQTQHDLLLMESIAIPLSFLVMVWVFGGLVTAALPMVVGGLAIVGSMSVLRLITFSTDVSIFALNLSTALGLALAIDYTLLIISRYRDELADGSPPEKALVRTMATAGRTVLFSATTVGLSMAVMLLFPMYFLRSFAYAGVATVAFAAAAAVIVTPAAIWLLRNHLNAFDVRKLVRQVFYQPAPTPKPVQQQFWYRSTRAVMRRAVPVGLAIVVLLLALGAPFLSVKWGFPDERVLPTSASAHQVGDELRDNFTDDSSTAVTLVIPDARGLTPVALETYAAALSRIPDVTSVSTPTGAFVAGLKSGPPTAATAIVDDSAFVTVGSTAPLFSDASEVQLKQLHDVTTPDGRTVLFAGTAQVNHDSVQAITDRLPWVLGLIGVITLVLLFLLTGSVVLPLKAVVLNVLSLTAAFGALVWVFQDGHLSALGTTPTGTLVANMPVLLFCIAFGLSMDYEVFLVSRIREYWLSTPSGSAKPYDRRAIEHARDDNDEAVAHGVARTGRVITAAAIVMSISFAALIAAQVSFMRMFGVGLTLAVLVDATLVRMVLVPAFMHVLGGWNWWAPEKLVRLHERIGFSESGESDPVELVPPEDALVSASENR